MSAAGFDRPIELAWLSPLYDGHVGIFGCAEFARLLGAAGRLMLVVVHELGHFPVKTNRQQAQQEPTEQGDEDRLFVGHVQVGAQQKAPRGREGHAGVKFATEDQRDVVAEDVTQDAAKHAGYHPAH